MFPYLDPTTIEFREISSLSLSDDILYGFSELGTDEFGIGFAYLAGDV